MNHDIYNESYHQGVLEGVQLAKINTMMDIIMKPDEFNNTVDEMIARGSYTEYHRQQALFYLRMGINEDLDYVV